MFQLFPEQINDLSIMIITNHVLRGKTWGFSHSSVINF